MYMNRYNCTLYTHECAHDRTFSVSLVLRLSPLKGTLLYMYMYIYMYVDLLTSSPGTGVPRLPLEIFACESLGSEAIHLQALLRARAIIASDEL